MTKNTLALANPLYGPDPASCPRWTKNVFDPQRPDYVQVQRRLIKTLQKNDVEPTSPFEENDCKYSMTALDPKKTEKTSIFTKKNGEWSRATSPPTRQGIKIHVPSAPSSPTKHQPINVLQRASSLTSSTPSPIVGPDRPMIGPSPRPPSPAPLDPRWQKRELPCFVPRPRPHSNKNSRTSEQWSEFHRPSRRDRERQKQHHSGNGKPPPKGPKAAYDHRDPRSRAVPVPSPTLSGPPPPTPAVMSWERKIGFAPASDSSRSPSVEPGALAANSVMPTISEELEQVRRSEAATRQVAPTPMVDPSSAASMKLSTTSKELEPVKGLEEVALPKIPQIDMSVAASVEQPTIYKQLEQVKCFATASTVTPPPPPGPSPPPPPPLNLPGPRSESTAETASTLSAFNQSFAYMNKAAVAKVAPTFETQPAASAVTVDSTCPAKAVDLPAHSGYSQEPVDMEIDTDSDAGEAQESKLGLDVGTVVDESSKVNKPSVSVEEAKDGHQQSVHEPMDVDESAHTASSHEHICEPISLDDLDALERNASAAVYAGFTASTTVPRRNAGLNPVAVATSTAGPRSGGHSGFTMALMTPESRMTTLSPAPSLPPQGQAPAPAEANRESPPPPTMKFWIQEGLSDIDRWNLEDRLKAISNVVLSESIDEAQFVLLNIPPGRTASDSSHLAVMRRYIVAVSSHWALASARQGRALNIAPFLVWPVASPPIRVDPEPQVVTSQLVLGTQRPAATRPREDPESEEEVAVAPKRRRTRHWSIESISPDRDDTKARRFVEVYNLFRNKFRKWMPISEALPEYPAEPTAWRAYFDENLTELIKLGLNPADAVPRRTRTEGKARSASRSQVSDMTRSVSTESESETDSDDSLGECEEVDEARNRRREQDRRRHRAAPREHLELLKESLDKIQPKDKSDFMRAYELAAGETQSTSYARTALGFCQLHRKNQIPGWGTGKSSKPREAEESSAKTDSDASSDSDDDGRQSEGVVLERTKSDAEPGLRSGITAVGSPYGRRSDDELREPSESTTPSVQQVSAAMNRQPSSSHHRKLLLAHLQAYDPKQHQKVAYIKSLAETQPCLVGKSWYNKYLQDRSYYEDRLPVLRSKAGRPRLSEVSVRTSDSPEEPDQRASEIEVGTPVVSDRAAGSEAGQVVVKNNSGLVSETGIIGNSQRASSTPLATTVDAAALRVIAMDRFKFKRWMTAVEEENLERFVAFQDMAVPYDIVFEQWSQVCSATPFTSQQVQVYVQTVGFDVFDEKVERRRAIAARKDMPVSWTPPCRCVVCKLDSPDLVNEVCVDCRVAISST